MINVTKTYLPPFEKYIKVLKRAWDKSWITNNGELVQELEENLKEYLGVKYLLFTTNGTVVLQMALKAFNITKEVITTPFSYVATTNAILWEGCTPVFVDIRPENFCIDTNKIEDAITENTEAILATHVYGLPCDIEKIQEIAEKYKLKVIYDAAHAFGCKYKGKSLLSFGDITTCSFHATKIFHTVEGGCIITHDQEIARKLMLYRQFGHIYDDYFSIGINAKNSEFHAAMGLCVFEDLETLIALRKEKTEFYNEQLKSSGLSLPDFGREGIIYNYCYYPILFDSEDQLLSAKERLCVSGINTRRYFYPSLNKLPFLKGNSCPISEETSKKVLCLPLFHDLLPEEQLKICAILKKS